ncbi:MAG: hypothetical protein KF726_11195 [Anaerolineae bacterium]|nr:hypothetical protein [Anaerolineae bacterium]
MPKALFFNVPAHGHINPSLPLVAELTKRGHQIIYFATPKYRSGIEAASAQFQAYNSIPDDYFESQGLSGAVPMRVADALISTSEQVLPELLEITRAAEPDYLMFDGMCTWGFLLSQITKLPAVTSLSLMPLIKPPLNELLKREMLSFLLSVMLRGIDKGIQANIRARALGKKYNIPPLGMAQFLNGESDLSLSYSSAYFQPYADTVSSSVRFVGWTLNGSPDDSSFPFDQIGDRRLIYASLGTINNDDVGFFKACIEAFTGSDYFVVISTGNRISPDSFGAVPANVLIRSWVPQTEILKRAALFITHGGMNSVHDGLYLNVPLLLVPQQAEQALIATRVVELGAGLMLKKAEMNTTTIREKADRLLTEASYQAAAQRIGDSFRAAGGAIKAADEVEVLLSRSRVHY